jgi:putative SOS response-associated peptidase YedK
MCYSNSSTSSNVQLAERYKKKVGSLKESEPVYFANGFTFPNWRVITNEQEIQIMRWGLIPNWFKDTNPNEIAANTLNARIETVHEKASFKHVIDSKRCLVPSTGFFEWKHLGKERIPYFIYPSSEMHFSMAGIYDQWMEPLTGNVIRSFSILTTDANPLMREIHNTKMRMPAILLPELEESWISGDLRSTALQLPFPQELMSAREVSKKILNSPHANQAAAQKAFNNGIGEQGSLF